MPSKDKKVIGVKVSDSDYQWIETYANTHNISISALVKLYFDALKFGDVSVEKGELKLGVNPIGYAVCDDFDTPFGEKIEKRMNKLRERDYPEAVICSIKEQILSAIDEELDRLPKKYDARRMRNSDCGC